jgi:hypothetical protein
LRDVISVTDFGATGDGTTDDTAAINLANAAATGLRKRLYFPAGTYIATQLTVLAYQNWLGEDVVGTIIKLKSGTNPVEGSGALIWSPSINCDEASFENFTFDGNFAGNTQGDTLVLKGCRTRIKCCKVNNSASNAIITDFNPASAERSSGLESSFMDITIDKPQKTGWIHNGPNDSNFDGIIIIDSGAKTNNTYYGMYLASPYGGGRFNNLHPWNRDSSTNIASASLYVGSSGNTFTNCHIEGGMNSLYLVGSANVFASCAYYAPRGTTCINITASSSSNVISGLTGLVYASANPNYATIAIASADNKIDLSVNGANSGVFFSDSGTGNNIVTITGFLTTYGGQYLYSGTYSTTDVIKILVGGSGGGSFNYPAIPTPLASSATSFTSAVNPGAGSFTSSVSAAYYYRVGKMVFYDVYYNISAIGTASGVLNITLPSFATANGLGTGVGSNSLPGSLEGHFTAGGLNYHSYSAYNATSPSVIAGNGHVAGWYIEV